MRRLAFVPSFACVLALACGSDQGPDQNPVPAELVGTWVAESACAPPCTFLLTAIKNSAYTLELVGASFELGIAANGTATLDSSLGSTSGSIEVSGNRMYLRDVGAGVADTIDWSIQGNYLHLAFQNEISSFDLDGDQVNDPAHATAVFEKR